MLSGSGCTQVQGGSGRGLVRATGERLNTMSEERGEEPELLDLLMAQQEATVSVKIARDLLEPLERIGRSWQCASRSETIERMIERVEHGKAVPAVFAGHETRRLIAGYLGAGKRLPTICALLNKEGWLARDGAPWTTEKLAIFCQYHGLAYRHS